MVGIDQGVSIPASSLGKAKTTSQIVCHHHPHVAPRPLDLGPCVEVPAVAIMVALTLISGVQYFMKARDNLHLPGTGK